MLTTSYPRFEEDPSGVFVRGLARALALRGHQVEVLAPEPSEGRLPPLGDGVALDWVRYAWPRSMERTFYGAGVPDNVRRDPRAWLGLVTAPPALLSAAARRAAGWDALLSHWALPSALIAGALRGPRPHLAVLHSADVHLLTRLPARAHVARAIGRSADRLVFASPALASRWAACLRPVDRSLRGRARSQAMGIDPPPPARPRDEARRALGLTRFTLLSLGRLVPIKGTDRLIEATVGLDLTLLIAGEGPERARLERLAGARGVDARFVGVAHGETKEDLFAASDLFVLASHRLPSGRTEGMPTVLLEAAARGVPIIAADTGGVRSTFGDALGYVPEGDTDTLARALKSAMGDRERSASLARRAREVAMAHTWPVLAPQFEAELFGAREPDRPTARAGLRLPRALGWASDSSLER